MIDPTPEETRAERSVYMLNLSLLDNAYPDGDSLPNGTKFKNGIYSQNAIDKNGIKYQISWEVIDPPCEENDWDESTCCDWDNPTGVYCYPDSDQEYPSEFAIGDYGQIKNIRFELAKNGGTATLSFCNTNNYYINDLKFGTNEFKDTLNGVEKNISIEKDISHLFIRTWNAAAKSKYDENADMNIISLQYDPENSNSLYVIPYKVFENVDILAKAGSIVKLSI